MEEIDKSFWEGFSFHEEAKDVVQKKLELDLKKHFDIVLPMSNGRASFAEAAVAVEDANRTISMLAGPRGKDSDDYYDCNRLRLFIRQDGGFSIAQGVEFDVDPRRSNKEKPCKNTKLARR